MADLVGVAAVIGSAATFISTVGLTVRSFMPNRYRNDDDHGGDDTTLDMLERLEERRRERRKRRDPDDDDTGAYLSRIPWPYRRKALA